MKKPPKGEKEEVTKVTVEITAGMLKKLGKKAKRTGAIVSIVLALGGGSYVAGHTFQPHISVSWQQEG